MFAVKAGTYPVKHLSGQEPRVGYWPHPQTLDWAGKACQGQTL